MSTPEHVERSLRNRVLARFLDGEPEPEDGVALAEALRADPAFAAEVRRLLAVDDLLRRNAQPDPDAFVDALSLRIDEESSPDLASRLASALPGATVPARTPIRLGRAARLPSLRSTAALVMSIAVVAALLWALVPGKPAPAARLVRVQDAWWQPGLGVEVGEELPAERWASLDEGLAEFEFTGGARATVRGPSLFRFCSGRCLLMSEGAVSVFAPEAAAGFTVLTPGSEVVDLGTEFSVLVRSPQAAEVHVRKGRVEVRRAGADATDETTHPLKGGEAVEIDELAGRVMPRRYSESAFQWVGATSDVKVAYRTREGTDGNQLYDGKLGHDFVVRSPIDVTRLGVFDSGSDGLARLLVCELWDRDDRGTPEDPRDDAGLRRLASLRFYPGSPGQLIDGNRFKPLPRPLRLGPGSYSVVAYGYGLGEPNGNDGGGLYGRHLKARDGGDGLISFLGSGRFEFHISQPRPSDPDAFPEIVDGGRSPDRYSAGTFEFIRAASSTGR